MSTMQGLIGQTLGQYKIIEQIGEGGMATVFRAYQPGLDRDIALKILPPYVAQKAGFSERFTREAQAIGNLHHPNILPVYDFGQDKGYGYIAMRYIPDAATLTRLMRQPLPPQQIIQLTTQIARALAHAHQAGIIHRDIKPSNILMDKEWVLLSDFGLAKMVETASDLTGTGMGIGTPAYMSPEQAKAEAVDHRTDIYALGIIVFEMLTGQVPHKAETPLATVVKRINEPIPLPRSLNPDIPELVERVLLKALAVNPADRFDNIDDFASALKMGYESQLTLLATKTPQQVDLPLATPLEPVVEIMTPPSEPLKNDIEAKKPNVGPLDVIFMGLLGIITVLALGGTLLSFIPDSTTGESNLALLSPCLGLAFSGLSGILMIWLRDRRSGLSLAFVFGLLFWFIGINIMGWGGFAVASPGNNTFTQNFISSLALCFTPGIFLTVLGLGFYGYDYRRRKGLASPQLAQAGGSNLAKQNRLQKLSRAAEYHTHIVNLIRQKKGSNLADQLTPIPAKLNLWQTHLKQLVERLNNFETNSILQRDLQDVPLNIARLQSQLERESNLQVRHEIVEAISKHQEHKHQLDALVTLMRRTELDIDETLAAIGAIYSQLQLIGARDVDSQRAKRLSADINEQAERLGDVLSAMDDVYQSAIDL